MGKNADVAIGGLPYDPWLKHGGWKTPYPLLGVNPDFDHKDRFGHKCPTLAAALGNNLDEQAEITMYKRLEALGEKSQVKKKFLEEERGIKNATFDYSTPALAFPEHAGGNEGIPENMIDSFRSQATLYEPKVCGLATPIGAVGLFCWLGMLVYCFNIMCYGREVAWMPI